MKDFAEYNEKRGRRMVTNPRIGELYWCVISLSGTYEPIRVRVVKCSRNEKATDIIAVQWELTAPGKQGEPSDFTDELRVLRRDLFLTYADALSAADKMVMEHQSWLKDRRIDGGKEDG